MNIAGTTSYNIVTNMSVNTVKAAKDAVAFPEDAKNVQLEKESGVDLVAAQQPDTETNANTIDSLTAYEQSTSDSMVRLTQEAEDVDSEKYISDSNKQKLLGLYQMYSQKLDVNSQENLLTTMFGR